MLMHGRATSTVSPPPPCGEGSGVGVVRLSKAAPFSPAATPHPTLPHKGGGSARAEQVAK